MAQDLPPEGTIGVAPDGTRVVVRNGQIVPLDAPAPTGPEAAGFVSLGGGWYRGPDGASYQQGRGGAMVKRASAPEGAGGDDVDLRAAAELRGRLILGLGPVSEAQQRLEAIERTGYSFNKDWGARAVDAIPGGDAAARVWGGADYQRLETAARSFESAMLPVFAGAAVTESEAKRFIRANLPSLGDNAETLETKSRNRRLMVNAAATLLGQDLPNPELGVFGALFGGAPQEVAYEAAVPVAERLRASGAFDVAPGPSGDLPGGRNVGTGNAPPPPSGRPVEANGLPTVSARTAAAANSVFDSAEIVERDGRPFYRVGLRPGEGAPADLQTRYGGDGEITAEEMRAAGYVPDAESDQWLFPVSTDRLPQNEGVAVSAAPPSSAPAASAPPAGGPGDGPGGGLPWWAQLASPQGQLAAQQAFVEQIPGGDELVALAHSLGTGGSYADSRAAQAMLADYQRQATPLARNLGGVGGAAATIASPLGAPLQITRGASLGGRVLNRFAGGALGGSVYGVAADDGNLLERADGALGGAAVGGVGGVAAPWVAGRVSALGDVLTGGARVVGRNVGQFGAERGVPGAARLVEASAPRVTPLESGLAKFAQRSPQDAEAMRAAAAAMQAETIAPTFADAINEGGRGMVGALATRQTPGRDAARRFAEGRAVDIQDRISGQARRLISDDLRTPMEIREAALKEAREAARPLYAQAYEQPIEVTSAIEDILRRPAGRRAMERARAIAANEGRNPDELRLVAIEDWGLPTGGGSAVPRPAADPNLSDDLRALRDGVSDRRAGRGKTLMQFIADNGGIRDEWGELSAIGTEGWARGAPWRRQILQENGQSLETMAQRAADAGYFDDLARPGMDDAANMSVVDRDRLLAAFDEEMAGRPRYARESDPAALARKERRADLEERLSREGLNPRATSARDAARAFDDADDLEARMAAHLDGSPPGPPSVDIVRDSQPTMETLDYIKRGLDDVLETYRDPVTGQMRLDDEGRAIEVMRGKYRKALVDLNPTYGDALAAYEGPIRLQRAADIGEGLLSTETDRFGAGVQSLRTPRERDVARSAAARAIERAAGTQGAAPGVAARLSTGRELRPRLEAIVGPRGADDVQRAMGAELRALQNARDVTPRTGSPTAPRLSDQAAAAGDAVGLAVDVGTGNVGGVLRRTVDSLRNRLDFNNAQAEAVVTAAVDPSQTGRMMQILADRMRPREFRNLSRAVRHQINSNLLQSPPEARAQ